MAWAAVIKVFFKLETGGILLIQIAVGSCTCSPSPGAIRTASPSGASRSLALCLSAFSRGHHSGGGAYGVQRQSPPGASLLAAGEVPRIAGAFGLDTTTRANIMSAVYTAQAAVNTTRTIVQAVK